mmetsp:Transcript_41653/g.125839  ORF Transcript_41653/g.125839 Transcript_41653/m.125839 type:complete len:85 (+) Transcript_41653:164-418(+)
MLRVPAAGRLLFRASCPEDFRKFRQMLAVVKQLPILLQSVSELRTHSCEDVFRKAQREFRPNRSILRCACFLVQADPVADFFTS